MKVNQIAIELIVRDVAETVEFYQSTLGFELLVSEEEEGKMYWAKLEMKGFYVSFKEEQRLKKEVDFMKDHPIGGSIAICLQVEDLTGFYNKVSEACELLDHPHLTPCGATQFSMKDNNGYIITVERFG
ncbi:glyoxalase/bleomycin resistance/extradiol dioxygenase family protein [Fulvivirga sp. M361]|uniref:VOC family protein n=1 Tax=Fulvivirga sp. M361 TaxID=2594266 RepID=UPI001627B27C|nr:VOC family protein [Fulvivirga sp. M361]